MTATAMSRPAPVVSVLMTVYNGERFLAEAIDSVLEQTFGDFEFIIVDDGSSDGTARIIRDYARRDERIRFLQLPDNRGPGTASNLGLRGARGQYIARMDCDDICLPRRLQTQVAYLRANPHIGAVGASILSTDDQLVGRDKLDYAVQHALIVFNLLTNVRVVAHNSVMMRRETLLAAGGYQDGLRLVVDLELWTRLASRTRIANLQEVLMLYRRHEHAVSNKFEEAQRRRSLDTRRAVLRQLWGSLPYAQANRLLTLGSSPWFSWREGRAVRRDLRQLLDRLEARNWIEPSDKPLLMDEIDRRVRIGGHFFRRVLYVLDSRTGRRGAAATRQDGFDAMSSPAARANLQAAPRVSVLMTVYNGERFLADAINSVLEQTFGDFEFIIVDDGSADGTARIIRDCARRDGRIHFRQLARNRGQAIALNHGLDVARGQFITRMDCDDISLPQRLQKQVDYLKAHPEIGVLGAAQQMVDETLQPLALETYPQAHAQIVVNHLAGLASIGGAVVMMRADALAAIGAFEPQRHTARDWELFAKLSARARLANLPDVLYRYRRHGQNMTVARQLELKADWMAYRQRWFNRLLGEDEHATAAFERFLAMYQGKRLSLRERALLRRDARRLIHGFLACPSFVAEDEARLDAALAARLPSLAPRLWTRLVYWQRKRLGA